VPGALAGSAADSRSARRAEVRPAPLHERLDPLPPLRTGRELGDLLALRALDAPVVAVVQGTAAGAGVSLAISADIALAAESATFTMAYTNVGLSPDGGSTWLLPRLIGPQRASALMLLNTTVAASEAAQLGLVAPLSPTASSTRRPRGRPTGYGAGRVSLTLPSSG
jgi:enoyl-CoA hydratase/carnithine racemase